MSCRYDQLHHRKLVQDDDAELSDGVQHKTSSGISYRYVYFNNLVLHHMGMSENGKIKIIPCHLGPKQFVIIHSQTRASEHS